MLEIESVPNPILDRALAVVAKTPYNSLGGIYRVCCAQVDTTKFGDDCVGQLNQLTSLISLAQDIQYIQASFRGVKHIASIIDGYYVDPFLFQTKPVLLENLEKNRSIYAPTLSSDQVIEISLNQLLNVRLLRLCPNNKSLALVEYEYDLESANREMPKDEELVHTNVPYNYDFVTLDGYRVRLIYDYKKGEFKSLMFNSDCEKVNSPIERYCEQSLFEQYGITYQDLKEYFLAANELQKYTNWWTKIKET